MQLRWTNGSLVPERYLPPDGNFNTSCGCCHPPPPPPPAYPPAHESAREWLNGVCCKVSGVACLIAKTYVSCFSQGSWGSGGSGGVGWWRVHNSLKSHETVNKR